MSNEHRIIRVGAEFENVLDFRTNFYNWKLDIKFVPKLIFFERNESGKLMRNPWGGNLFTVP